MTHRRRDELVETRAALVLADELTVEAFTDYFEAQMNRGKVRKLLRQLHPYRHAGAARRNHLQWPYYGPYLW
jgi:hypothetical protein